MTFQIRYNLKGTISFCDDAIFYSEPISGFSELYTQRQRWQRGELEVINKYLSQVLSWKQFFINFQIIYYNIFTKINISNRNKLHHSH